MDQLNAMRTFIAVAERQSLTGAADTLNVPRSSVTKVLQRLEAHLGAHLINRTTRRLELTQDGQVFLERAIEVLQAIESMEAAVGDGARSATGPLRVEMGTTMAQEVILPVLSEFAALHPGIELTLGISDRAADILREHVDCVIRVGEIVDLTLAARKVGMLGFATVAAPSYLERKGRPAGPEDLRGHALITYLSPHSGRPLPQVYQRADQRAETTGGPGGITLNETSSYVSAAVRGLGIAQVMRFMAHRQLATGELVEILPDWSRPDLPVYVAFATHRHLSKRAVAFADWAMEKIQPFCVD